jgi:hypothetical protein
MDPHHQRQHPHAYDADELHAMLIDDYVTHRPLGGPGVRGAAFLIGACEKIAAVRGITPEVYFQAFLAEGVALTGSTAVAMA